MTQRLLRRFLTSDVSRKPSHGRWQPIPSETLQTPQCSPADLTVTPNPTQTIYTIRISSMTFNNQDGPDFQDEVVISETPVVLDFHAQWCGPCKILGPRLEKMVAKQHGKVVMAKVDVDDHTELDIESEVLAVPTVLTMKNGDMADKFVSIKDEDQLVDLPEKADWLTSRDEFWFSSLSGTPIELSPSVRALPAASHMPFVPSLQGLWQFFQDVWREPRPAHHALGQAVTPWSSSLVLPV
ncbi:thioredoxin 2 [Saguinus oedipus]|uniref:Thioredoxin 2 n=1 Tax=Saguinus oedipus TaxID=9490 RepID=A0ABQ9VCJ4_SAGOE|nr:thioredoxin 2 [Saguinus oedipus]